MRQRNIEGASWVCPVCYQRTTAPCVGTLTGRKLSRKHNGQPARHRDVFIERKQKEMEALWEKEAQNNGLTDRQRKLADIGRANTCRFDLVAQTFCDCAECKARSVEHVRQSQPTGRTPQGVFQEAVIKGSDK